MYVRSVATLAHENTNEETREMIKDGKQRRQNAKKNNETRIESALPT